VPGLVRRAVKASEEFAGHIDRIRARLRPGAALSGIIAELLRDVGFEAALEQEAASHDEWRARWRNVGSLLRTLSVYESKRGAEATLEDYLRSLSLEQKDDQPTERDQVVLMTLHSAKGLEFPVVFLCGVEEDILPHHRSVGGDVDEERRLFYVGITRAREQLVLTAVRNRTRHRERIQCRYSRFVDEIPADAIDRPDGDPGESPEDAQVREAALARIAALFE
jgi:superfamily I DNA/RNA helicase